MLKEIGIVIDGDAKACSLFEEIIPDFFKISYNRPSEYVKNCWEAYTAYPDKNNSLNGRIFEYILATLCVREDLLPFHISAKVAFVPNVIYDIMFYSPERGPICISAKTSLRERYKQADLEAIALKYVHRKSLSFLVTLNEAEALSVKNKILSGDVIGLDKVVVADSTDFDELMKEIKEIKLESPPIVKVIEATQTITKEKIIAFKTNQTN